MTLTRRDLLKLGAGAGLGLAAGLRPRDLSAREQEMIYTTIPSSGERVPAVGIGTRSYRADLSSDDLSEFRETLRVFHQGGGTLLDTAPGYGNSEEVLGHLLGELELRSRIFMATKVDREGRDEGIRRMERSFNLLGGDTIDLMQVHNLRDAETQLETMRAWKDRGRFRYVGITTSSERQYEAMERLMRTRELDFIQLDYSLANRSADEVLLPLARDRGMAVLVNLPFGRGRLFRAVGDRPLPDWAGEIDADTWAQVFLKYVISHEAATIPIPGTSQPHHARDNINAARGRLPDRAMRREMEAFYDALP